MLVYLLPTLLPVARTQHLLRALATSRRVAMAVLIGGTFSRTTPCPCILGQDGQSMQHRDIRVRRSFGDAYGGLHPAYSGGEVHHVIW